MLPTTVLCHVNGFPILGLLRRFRRHIERNGLDLGDHQLPLLLGNDDFRIRFRFFMTVFSCLLCTF